MNLVDNSAKIREAKSLLFKCMDVLDTLDLYAMNSLSSGSKLELAKKGEAFAEAFRKIETEVMILELNKPADIACFKTYKDRKGKL